jgi:hypothetical protein
VLQRFLHFYALSFHDIARALLQAGPVAALYPSSTYVAERPAGLAEYAMAKAAGEVLCADMAANIPGFRAHMLRLPPLPTDQNPHLRGAGGAAALLLDGLRALR